MPNRPNKRERQNERDSPCHKYRDERMRVPLLCFVINLGLWWGWNQSSLGRSAILSTTAVLIDASEGTI